MPARAASGYRMVGLKGGSLRREYFEKSNSAGARLLLYRPISLRRSQPEKLSIAITISTIRIM